MPAIHKPLLVFSLLIGAMTTSTMAGTAFGPYKVELADVTGNGCPDLVLGYQGAGVVIVEQGDCAAGFQRLAVNAFQTGDAIGDRHVHNMHLYDADGDGDLDIGITIGGRDIAHPGTVIVAENVGGGVLAERARLSVPSEAKGVVLGDFDGDGKVDVAATASGRGTPEDIPTGRLYIWPRGSGWSFGDPVFVETGYNAYNVVSGDVDANGTPDFVVANAHADYVSVVLNPGEGLFSTGPAVRTLDLPQPRNWDVPRLNDAKLADLNGDGALDVLGVSTNGGVIGVWPGNGDGTFRAPRVLAAGDEFSAYADICDVDDDGHMDVIVTHYTSLQRTTVFLGSAGGLLPPTAYPTGLGSYGVTCANYDNPGSPLDFITANYASRTISMVRGNGDGTFEPPETVPRGIKWDGSAWVSE